MNFDEIFEIIDKNQNKLIQLNVNQISNINSVEIFYLLSGLEMKLIDPNQVLNLGLKLKSTLIVGFSFRFQYNRANPNIMFNNIHVLVHVIKLFIRSSNTDEEQQLLSIMYLLLFKNSSINSAARNDSKITIKEMLIQYRMTSLLERLESFKKNIDEYILLNKLSVQEKKRFNFIINKNSLNLLGYSLDDYDLISSFNLKRAVQSHCSIDNNQIDTNKLIIYSCMYSSPESMKYLSFETEENLSPIMIQKLILTIEDTRKYKKLNELFNYYLMKIMTISSLSSSFLVTEEQLNLLNIKFQNTKTRLRIKSDHLIEDSREKLSNLINYLQLEKDEKIIFDSEEIKRKFRKLLEINSIQLSDHHSKLIIQDEEQYQVFNEFNDEIKSLLIAMFALNRLKLDYTYIEKLKKKL